MTAHGLIVRMLDALEDDDDLDVTFIGSDSGAPGVVGVSFESDGFVVDAEGANVLLKIGDRYFRIAVTDAGPA